MTSGTKQSDGAGDPNLWLEEISGARADAWVRAENAKTIAALCDDTFDGDRAAVHAMLDNDQRIPWITRRGKFVYNTWTDARNPRGLWRRTTLDSYKTASPDWETVLDVDALGKADGKAWKFGGAAAYPPEFKRALVRLSPGGSDACEVREFDLVAKRFVEGGFSLPEAKCWAFFEDGDTIVFGHAAGADHTTSSGYSRTVRRLKRGQAMADAEVIYRVGENDMVGHAGIEHDSQHGYISLMRVIDFFRREVFIERRGQTRRRIEVPDTASLDLQRDMLLIRPRYDWQTGGVTVPAGALAVANLWRFLDGDPSVSVLFKPEPRRALSGWIATRGAVVINIMDNVTGRIDVARQHADGTWSTEPMPGIPANASVGAMTLDDSDGDVSDDVLIHTTSFTSPPAMQIWPGIGAPKVLKQSATFFDASAIEARQYEAIAADGERIPYFLVGQRHVLARGNAPTVLYGYGGFEVSQGPAYIANAGKLWMERGGLYAMANIRGGGEFGPDWHKAGLREKKYVSHDDFAAVARDLAARGVTQASKLAGWGGSNGGLLVGNMLTRYPELFGAIVCQVPLLDMARYTKLLAGASWIAEYGDPDEPAEWAFIEKMSPYHQIAHGRTYPKVLFTTSRNDDRVHPGHARKMAARLAEFGHETHFYENIEGGHGGAADNAQAAYNIALAYAFVRRTLMGSAV
jgi:prolyl oligopeptidase